MLSCRGLLFCHDLAVAGRTDLAMVLNDLRLMCCWYFGAACEHSLCPQAVGWLSADILLLLSVLDMTANLSSLLRDFRSILCF
jgi:hypothetical protein